MAIVKRNLVSGTGLFMFSLWCLLETIFAQAPDIVFTLKEEMNPGVFIGNVAVSSGVGQDVAVEEFPYLEYNFLNPNDKVIKSLFSINRPTGAMYSTSKVDREEMCNKSVLCQVTFDVTIQSSATTFLRLLSVRVEIEDVNDNPPKFGNKSVIVDIPENVVVGTNFRITGATDEDMSVENTVQSYELVQPDKTFGVQLIKKFDGSTDVSLSVLKPLDRESQDVHSILLLAKDNGSPQRTGSLLVNINVVDANDNEPKFIKDVYNITVSENTTVGMIIETLKALDVDSGENSNVSYRFSPLRTSKLEHLLVLNGLNGELSVKSPLHYESGKTYETIVEASDNGNPPQITQTILIVNIVDVGNNPPRLQLNLASAMNSETIILSEGSKVGTFVGHIKVEDRDPGVNGIVMCYCDEEHFALQKLDGKGYALLISKALDRETTSKHNVTVTCQDNGSPSLSSSIRFVVVITDENDNGPQFLQPVYVINVTENVDIGTTVGAVLAMDNDLEENSEFYYSLALDAGAMFHINSETGIITTNANIDRETLSKVTFVVRAIDNQNSRLSGTASVSVVVLDMNDNSPVFKPESLRIKAIENLQPGTILSKLAATDDDEGKNADLSFSAADHNSEIPFVVYEDGAIRLNSPLNRESQNIYEFDVMVQDKGDVPRTTIGRVLVKVVDANDHSPVIEFPRSGNDTVSIEADMKVGTLVAYIIAFDEDDGDNGDLEYSILSGNDHKLFEISPKTGEIILVKDISRAVTGFHQLQVSVKDQGAVRLEDVAFLKINILQSDEVVPPPAEASGQFYLIITGVVAGVTIILAIIIVTVIIRMKRRDRDHVDSEEGSSGKDHPDFEKVLPSTALPNTSINSDNSSLDFHPVKSGDNDIIFTSQNVNPDSTENRKRVSFSVSQVNGRAVNNDNKSNFSEESNGSDSGKGCSDDENNTFSLSETAPSLSWQHDIKDIVPPVPPRMPADKPVRYQAYYATHRPGSGRSQLPHVQFLDSFSRKPLEKKNSFTDTYSKLNKDNFSNLKKDISKSSLKKDALKIHNSFYSQEPKCFKDNLKHYQGHEALTSLSYNSLCHSSVCSVDDDQYSTTSGSYTVNSENEDANCAY